MGDLWVRSFCRVYISTLPEDASIEATGMTQPVKRPEVCPDPRRLFDRIDPSSNVRERLPVASDKDMVRRLGVIL